VIKRLLILLTLGVVILAAFNLIVWLQVLRPSSSEATLPVPRQTPATAAATATLPGGRLPAATATPPGGRPPATPALPATTQPELTTVDQISQAIANGQHDQRFRIVITQQEISDELAAYLQSNPNMAFSNISVQLQPGVAIINGAAQLMGASIGFKASTTIVIVSGRPRLKVTQIELGGALMPGAIKDLIGQMIEQQADLPILADLPVVITQVDIQAGQVVVIGSIPPA
jgi:hypothetical protein